MLYKLLQGKYHVVLSVSDDDVQRVRFKGAVTMATPATVVGDVRDVSHLAASVYELQGTQKHALRASVYHVTRAVVSGLEAYRMITKVEFVPCSFFFKKKKTRNVRFLIWKQSHQAGNHAYIFENSLIRSYQDG